MKANEIMEDIYQVREAHAKECDYDVDRLFASMIRELKTLQAEGWKVTSPKLSQAENISYVLRETPPGQKQ